MPGAVAATAHPSPLRYTPTFHLFRTFFSLCQRQVAQVTHFRLPLGARGVGFELLVFIFFLRALQNQRFFCVASGRRGIPQHHQSPIHGSDTRMTGQAGGPQHSLAGRVHLGCVEEVDAALVGDCHQLLSHLGEAKMDTWGVTVPSPPAHPAQGKAPEDAAKGLQRG